MSTTIRPGSEATSERSPCCNGRGFEYVESRGDLPPYEVRCSACRGAGIVDASPEPVAFAGDADLRVDDDAAAYWDRPRPAA